MKSVSILLWFVICLPCFADEEIVFKAKSGRFEITQQYRGNFLETFRFRDPALLAVELPGFPWPGNYAASPDEQWLLRTQKTGSGESVAMLYRIEENGRVSEVVGFDHSLWNASDQNSRLKKRQLYHKGVASFDWKEGALEIVLSGKNAAESGDGIRSRLVYNLDKNTLVTKSASSEKNKPPAVGDEQFRTSKIVLAHELSKEAAKYDDLCATLADIGVDYPVLIESALSRNENAIRLLLWVGGNGGLDGAASEGYSYTMVRAAKLIGDEDLATAAEGLKGSLSTTRTHFEFEYGMDREPSELSKEIGREFPNFWRLVTAEDESGSGE